MVANPNHLIHQSVRNCWQRKFVTALAHCHCIALYLSAALLFRWQHHKFFYGRVSGIVHITIIRRFVSYMLCQNRKKRISSWGIIYCHDTQFDLYCIFLILESNLNIHNSFATSPFCGLNKNSKIRHIDSRREQIRQKESWKW